MYGLAAIEKGFNPLGVGAVSAGYRSGLPPGLRPRLRFNPLGVGAVSAGERLEAILADIKPRFNPLGVGAVSAGRWADALGPNMNTAPVSIPSVSGQLVRDVFRQALKTLHENTVSIPSVSGQLVRVGGAAQQLLAGNGGVSIPSVSGQLVRAKRHAMR